MLLERTAELERIDLVLTGVPAGHGRGLLIQGQAGIGKTTLLDAARRHAAERGIAVLSAHGAELEGHFPFGVVRQLFEPVVHRAAPEVRERLLAGAAGPAASILGDVSAAEPVHSEDAFGVLHGLYWLTVNLSASAPLLIVVDDLHWADAGSLRFLLYLAARLDGLGCGVIGAVRPGDPQPAPALAARMASDGRFALLTPAPLSERAVHRFLAARLAREPDREFVAASAQATGGVPFLLSELVADLVADGVEPLAAQAARVHTLGPQVIAHAAAARLARMPDGCLPLARAVAVLGGDARLPRAVRLARLEESAALDALDALVAAGLVRTNGRLEFVHPILRAAIYDELAPGERSRLHRRAADVLASEGAEPDAVAAHLLPCAPTGSEDVTSQLREAAALALRRAAPDDAIAYLTRALDEGCSRELRAAIRFDLGRATRLNADPAMLTHFEEARRLADDPVLRSGAALELATAFGLTGQWDKAMTLVAHALEDLDGRDPELAVRLESYRAAILASDPRLVAEFDRRAATLDDLARRGGVAGRSLALLLALNAVWRSGDEARGAELVERGWDGGRLLDVGGDLWSLGQGLQALVIGERLEQARGVTEALLADGRARGSTARFVLASAYRGWIDAREGRLEDAEGALRAALDRARMPYGRYALCTYLWFAVDVMLERPRCHDLADVVRDLELDQMAGGVIEAIVREARGRLRAAEGDAAGAVEDLRRGGEIFAGLGMVNPNGSCWRSALALVLRGHDHEEARRLAGAELDDARRVGRRRGVGVALRALGVIEGDRDRLEEAVVVLEPSPARLELARALVELGAAMRRAGERAASRRRLRAGLDIAIAAGAARLADRARGELEASGARLRRDRITGRDALTPSELRVARLAADGLTNSEVAQALFVTPKTVDTHLTRAYSKLGISSRRALAAALGVAAAVATARASGPA